MAQRNETLGTLAAADLRKTAIFKKYGLDYCCGGKKTLRQACIEKGLDVSVVVQDLLDVAATAAAEATPYAGWNLDFLADYIVQSYHSYEKKSLPRLVEYTDRVACVHGERHPELIKIRQLVDAINQELQSSMIKEEQLLFPAFKILVNAGIDAAEVGPELFASIQHPISAMEAGYQKVGSILAEIRTLSNGYALPEDASSSYALLYTMLVQFEENLQMHIHLDNNILFPKALSMTTASR